VVVLVERGRKALIANVSDSRAYLERKGKLFQITKDDDILSELVRDGYLSREKEREIRRAMNRVSSPADVLKFNKQYGYNFKFIRNRITACLGGGEEAIPKFSVVELQSGDRLLACSDGVHENLKARQINEMLIKSKTPQEAAQRLKNSASAESVSGSGRAKPDDITAVVAEVNFVIESVGSFQELYKVLDQLGGLRGTRKDYNAEELSKAIGQVIGVKAELNTITRTGGLRKTVKKLLEKELVPA